MKQNAELSHLMDEFSIQDTNLTGMFHPNNVDSNKAMEQSYGYMSLQLKNHRSHQVLLDGLIGENSRPAAWGFPYSISGTINDFYDPK